MTLAGKEYGNGMDAPALCLAAHLEDRASVDQRRFNMLTGN